MGATRDSQLQLSFRHVSIFLMATNIATLVGLVIALDVRDLDVLATAALVLAIVAFVVQIMLFVMQLSIGNEQVARSQEALSEMRQVLAAIDTRSVGTEAAISQINEKVLVHLLGRAVQDTRKAGIDSDSPEFESRVAERTAELANVPRGSPGTGFPRKEPGHEAEDARIAALLRTWPSAEETLAAISTIEGLPSLLQQVLGYCVKDELRWRDPERGIIPGVADLAGSEDLAARGLMKVVAHFGGRDIYGLTDDGRTIARVLASPMPPPEGYPRVEGVRRLMAEYLN